MAVSRPVQKVVPSIHTYEGAGFGVFRPFPQPGLDVLDPFLLLDEMEPRSVEPGEAKGAPDHPHRGFETVTYMLEGEFEHRDSQGNHGLIGTGGVQWMTAGGGIIHSEMPSERVQAEGGTIHGFQLWVNLPAADKMTRPRYQGLDASDIPVANGDGWVAYVIAGDVAGVHGPAGTHTAIVYAHVSLDAGGDFTLDVPDDYNAGAYVFAGAALVGPDAQPVRRHELAVWHRQPGGLVLRADEPAEALVLAGLPLGEPIARYGPFVMNTREQLIEAFDDYQAGRMGTIAAEGRV